MLQKDVFPKVQAVFKVSDIVVQASDGGFEPVNRIGERTFQGIRGLFQLALELFGIAETDTKISENAGRGSQELNLEVFDRSFFAYQNIVGAGTGSVNYRCRPCL